MSEIIIEDNTQQILEYDGAAWKEKNNGAYISVLDRYNASELFVDSVSKNYIDEYNADTELTTELAGYIWDGRYVMEDGIDAELSEYLFSKEVNSTGLRPNTEINITNLPLTTMLCVFLTSLSALIIYKYSCFRREKREKNAAEDNMEI